MRRGWRDIPLEKDSVAAVAGVENGEWYCDEAVAVGKAKCFEIRVADCVEGARGNGNGRDNGIGSNMGRL